MRIEQNEVEWISNGERASATNLNRALKQYLNKNNEILDDIYGKLDLLEVAEGTLRQIDNTTDNVGTEHLDKTLVRTSNVSVQRGLPVGWYCSILASGTDIDVTLDNETEVETGASVFTLSRGRTAKLLKISNNEWSVSIDRLVLTVETD